MLFIDYCVCFARGGVSTTVVGRRNMFRFDKQQQPINTPLVKQQTYVNSLLPTHMPIDRATMQKDHLVVYTKVGTDHSRKLQEDRRMLRGGKHNKEKCHAPSTPATKLEPDKPFARASWRQPQGPGLGQSLTAPPKYDDGYQNCCDTEEEEEMVGATNHSVAKQRAVCTSVGGPSLPKGLSEILPHERLCSVVADARVVKNHPPTWYPPAPRGVILRVSRGRRGACMSN